MTIQYLYTLLSTTIIFLLYSESNPDEWAKCYNKGALAHNLHSERKNRHTKSFTRPNMRIDQLVAAIQELEDEEHLKLEEVKLNLRRVKASKAQHDWRSAHPTNEVAEEYIITRGADQHEFFIRHRRNQNDAYRVQLNPFSRCEKATCRVRCKKCSPNPEHQIPCAHFQICWCQRNCYR